MAIDKIELHEVEINTKQVVDASGAIKQLQDDVESTLDEYKDISERFHNGEVSKQEFSDLTRSKNEHISASKEKLNEHFRVFRKSLEALDVILVRAQKKITEATSNKGKNKKAKKTHRAPKKAKKESHRKR